MREKVTRYLQKKFAAKKISGTLVFDGAHRRGEESGLSYSSPLVIAYAPKGQSADEYIVEQIHTSKSPKQITVVTNDRGLTRHAMAAGAKAMDNDTFVHFLKKKKQTEAKCEIKESATNIDRLEKIFEERLKRDLSE